jgi:DNA polymerase-3 subunit gamma/tau
MAYTALYRKLRPNNFQDVIGQEHIVQTLTNQIKANRIGHAYLFCGTRGTGKTSTAKIFAKAVNCISPIEGSPCNECEICQVINEQKSMNIIEIDAASNNGVDNIRDIRDEVRYTPTEGKYKVYIIDEVHMLSIGAFNALLKTLEEPPGHIIFILATTEPHKIPITILSRCQRYDFKRISVPIIAGQLMTFMEKENVEVEDKAIQYIAKVGDGSMRDALSILDQCISFFIGQRLTLEKVLDILGAVDTKVFERLLDALLEQQVDQCLDLVENLMMQGRDLSQFINDFTWFLRNMLVAKTVDDASYILDMAEETLLSLKKQAQRVSMETVVEYIRLFSELGNQIKYTSQKRVLLEVTLIKLCQPSMDENVDSLYLRLEALERKMEKGILVDSQTMPSEKQIERPKEPVKERPKALSEDMKKLLEKWPQVMARLPVSIKPYLKKTKLDIKDSTLYLVCEDELTKSILEVPEKKQLIKEHADAVLDKAIDLMIKLNEGTSNSGDEVSPDLYLELQKKVNFDITYEE